MTGHVTRSIPLDEAFACEFLDRLRALFNAHDLDGLTSLMAEDVIFEHPLAGIMHGRAEIRAFYASFWNTFPDLAVELADGPFFHPHAPRITMDWLGTGTHTGPLDPPGLPPTGRRIQGHVWEMFEVRDGLMCLTSQVFDTAGLMRQLGVLPAQGSRAERGMVALQRLRMKLSRRR